MSMQRNRHTGGQLGAVQNYLEREFPGQVQDTWWDAHNSRQIFAVAHGPVRHQVEIASAFLQDCPDCTTGLRYSELAEYIREAQVQARRFIVMWQKHEVRIRFQPL
jgi:hypothetical protein